MRTITPEEYEAAYTRAVGFVARRMRGQPWEASDLPEEIASEAMIASCDPDRYPWRGDKPFDQHVVNVARSLLSDDARAAKLRTDPKRRAAADEGAKRSALPADARLRARDRAAREQAHDAFMMRRLTGTSREVYLLYKQDIFDVDQQAAILKKPKSAIYEARARVVEVANEYEAEPESSPELAAPDSGDDRDPDPETGDGDDEAAS